MLSHTGTLWQYLGSFILYTLFAIGMIYAAYWYMRKNGAGLLAKKPTMAGRKLEIESVLSLEARKNLYVVKSGSERFLIATSMDGTQFLSRLESTGSPAAVETPAAIPAGTMTLDTAAPQSAPWYQTPEPETETASKPAGLGGRLMKNMGQSMQWLIASRTKAL